MRPGKARKRLGVGLLQVMLGALVLVVAVGACDGQTAGGLRERAMGALRTGNYPEALSMYEALTARQDVTGADQRGLLRVLMETGKYDEVISRARAFAGTPEGGAVLVTLGDALLARGKLDSAEAVFRQAVTESPDSLTARVRLAYLRSQRGGHLARDSVFRTLDRFIDIYNSRRASLSSRDLVAVGDAVRMLGSKDPQLFKDALRAYDEAARADTFAIEPRLLAAELLLGKYNMPEAGESFGTVLEVNPRQPRALLGTARIAQERGDPSATARVAQALQTNPNYAAALAFKAQLDLDAEHYEDAAASARRALEINPASIDALAALGAAQWLSGDSSAFASTQSRAARVAPNSADLLVRAAESAARGRLYATAANLAAQGVARDSLDWHARAVYGINLLRTGDIKGGREALEVAFAGDPYDLWIKNTLDLLDVMATYPELRAGRFVFVLDSADAGVLPLYLAPLAEEAFDTLASRYGWQPSGPVRLEVHRTHADFSVRTIGLPGLGALGVSFGDVLAMDSPSARDVGAFNWGSVFWHELAHTFTLGLSKHRVPRWLSEGLSVFEERRARTGWGDQITPMFVQAYAAGKMPAVSNLNDGFMRPSFPQQVVLSYYEASLVCEMIFAEHGTSGLREILTSYGRGESTESAFRGVLGISMQELDAKFDRWLRERYAGRFDAVRSSGPLPAREDRNAPAPGPFGEMLAAAEAAARSGNFDDAIQSFEQAKALFPEYAGPDSPYRALAKIYHERGDYVAEESELDALVGIAEDDYEAYRSLAAVRLRLADTSGAIAALEGALYVSPYDPDVHVQLATLASAAGEHERNIRERRAVLALGPVDVAAAEYEMARAYLAAGDRAAARKAVLRALERAPNYPKAQDLLLEIGNSSRPQGGS